MSDAKPTIRDVAKHVGVSPATVSQALNGKGRMANSTRVRVLNALRQFGYCPKVRHRPVVFLALQETPARVHRYVPFLEKHHGLTEALDARDISLATDFVGPGRHLQTELQRVLRHEPSAVVIDSDLGSSVGKAARFFLDRGIPVVQIGHQSHTDYCDAIVVDNYAGARAATEHLLAAGHTRIGTIRWLVDYDPASAEKHAGYASALSEAGVPVHRDLIVESAPNRSQDADDDLPGRRAIERLLDLDEPPTAVFVENSMVSAPLIYPANRFEGELPESISGLDIVHFEAADLSFQHQAMAGALAFKPRPAKCLRIHWRLLARLAAKRILERLDGEAGEPQAIRIAPRLCVVTGDEVTPIPIADPLADRDAADTELPLGLHDLGTPDDS